MFVLRLFVLLWLALGCLAGNRLFEEAAKSLRNDGVVKRYYTINPTSDMSPKRWGSKTINYCFKDEAAETAFADIVPLAMQKWYNSGLPETEYKFKRGNPLKCLQKSDVLTIVTSNTLWTSLGKGTPDPDADDDSKYGPLARWTLTNTVGLLRTQANIAHEIGHAWGLSHEHQMEVPWSGGGSYTPTTMERNSNYPNQWVFDATFGVFRFYCSNLADFDKTWTKIVKDYAKEQGVTDLDMNNIPAAILTEAEFRMTEACTIAGKAAERGFDGGSQWLPPYNKGRFRSDLPEGVDIQSNLDLRSIMIYNSKSGGAGAANGQDDDNDDVDNDVDNRALVVTFKDDTIIPKNIMPTPRDIQGIQSIYADEEAKKSKTVYTSTLSRYNQKLKDVFKSSDKCEIKPKTTKRSVRFAKIARKSHWARHAGGFRSWSH